MTLLDDAARHRFDSGDYLVEVVRCAETAGRLARMVSKCRQAISLNPAKADLYLGAAEQATVEAERTRWWQAGYIAQHDRMERAGLKLDSWWVR